MRKPRVFLAIAIALFWPAYASAAWNAWIDHSIVKIKQNGYDHSNTEVVSGSSSLTVKMAQNEFESFQVFIYADGESLTDVDVAVGTPTKGSDTITDIYIYKEHYVNCSSVSRPEYTTGYYPDALLPKVDRYYGETRDTFPFSITDGNIQGVWVDLGTTASTPAGTYTSTVTVSASGKSNITLNLTVEVWDFDLPATPTVGSAIAILDGLISTGHMGTSYDATTIDTLMPVYVEMAMYHRISTRPMTRTISSYDWNDSTKVLDNVSFTIYDGYYGDALDGTLITSGPYAGAKPRTAVIPHTGGNAMVDSDGDISNADKPTASTQYQQAWYDHFGAEGWDVANTLITMVHDEPNTDTVSWRGSTVTKISKALTQGEEAEDIDTSIYGDGTNFARAIVAAHNRSELSDWNGLFNPWVGHYAPANWEKTNTFSTYIYPAADYPSGMERQWTYLSCMSNGCANGTDSDANGQIDLSADADPMYNRMMSFYFRKQGVTDFWYFQMNGTFGNDPYNDLWPTGVEGSNGDGTLIYPGWAGEFAGTPAGANTPDIGGTHDIPIESMRLKYIRDAMEDMEYFQLADDAGEGTVSNSYVNTMFTDTHIALCYWNLNTDEGDLFTARENIAGLINSGAPQNPATTEASYNVDGQLLEYNIDGISIGLD